MASNALPVLPQVPQPRAGNVWATLTNADGRSVTLKLPDSVLWPPFYLLVGAIPYTFDTWHVPQDVNARIEVSYHPARNATCVLDITTSLQSTLKEKAA